MNSGSMWKTIGKLKECLSHPLTKDHCIDDPETTELRRRIIREKSFLRDIYRDWYNFIASAIPPGNSPILELGSGGGFLNEIIPNLITSDVLFCSGIKVVLDGQCLPFEASSLRGIVMVNVLHHIPNIRLFLKEAARCTMPGGVVLAVEPWVTPWSRFIYSKFHHELFEPNALDWEIPKRGPLSGANGALPWILFKRDREQFEAEFPEWNVREIQPFMPFRYLLSGGVSMRALQPGWTTGIWRSFERILDPVMNNLGMFARIVLQRAKG